MNYEMYLDESGNTGNPKYKNENWNFKNQPYFALGSLVVEESKRMKLECNITNILHKYDENLGMDKELK